MAESRPFSALANEETVHLKWFEAFMRGRCGVLCCVHPVNPTKSIIRIELEQQTYADSSVVHKRSQQPALPPNIAYFATSKTRSWSRILFEYPSGPKTYAASYHPQNSCASYQSTIALIGTENDLAFRSRPRRRHRSHRGNSKRAGRYSASGWHGTSLDFHPTVITMSSSPSRTLNSLYCH